MCVLQTMRLFKDNCMPGNQNQPNSKDYRWRKGNTQENTAKNNKFRIITDLRRLNGYKKAPHFANESIENVIGIIEDKDCAVSVDLKNGFFHIPIHKDSQKYFGFKYNNQF